MSLMESLLKFRNNSPPMSKRRLYVSRQFLDDMRAKLPAPDVSSSRGMPFPFQPLAGIPVIVTGSLPATVPDKSKPIIQRDRFVEYDESDMHWAGPLGLAAWPTKVVHCIESIEDAEVPERHPDDVVNEFVFRCSG